MSPELKKRIITGVVGGAGFLALLVFGGTIGIFLIVTLLSLAMVYEYAQMVFSMSDHAEKQYLMLLLAWFIQIFYLLAPQTEYSMLIISFLFLFIYFLYTAKKYEERLLLKHITELAFSIFGLVYLVFVPQYLRKIYELPQGLKWTILFLVIVWSCDSGAYFAGMKYGKRKLYPEISPKKTVEGFAGGIGAALVAAVIFRFSALQNVSIIGMILLTVCVGVVAQLGDLCESFLKRAFQVKDSGSLLPGHGGVLDRFDAIIFSVPVMYAGIRIFG